MRTNKAKALEKSIKKWKRNLRYAKAGEYEKIVHDAKDCHLCRLYNPGNGYGSEECLACPVYAFTERRWCEDTPFEEVHRLLCLNNGLSWSARSQAELVEATEQEIKFLKSLRAKKVRK